MTIENSRNVEKVTSETLTNKLNKTATVEANPNIFSILKVNENANSVVSTSADGSASALEYDITAAPALAVSDEGNHSLTATATDSAGNTSAASPASALQYNITSSAVPNLVVSDTTGTALTAGSSTSQAQWTVSGKGSVGDKINLYDNGELTSTVTVGSDGTWKSDLTLSDEGDHYLTVTATDTAGNTSAESDAFVLEYDLTPPAVPYLIVSNTAGDALIDGTATNQAKWSVNSFGSAGDTIHLYDNGVLIDTVTIGQDGTWHSDLTLSDEGAHNLTATATDSAGNTSPISSAFTLEYDITPPAAPAIAISDENSNPLTAGSTTNQSDLVVTGNGTLGDTVNLYDNGKLFHTVYVGQDGTWLDYLTLSEEGEHSITATMTDSVGNTSSMGPAFTLEYSTTPSAALFSNELKFTQLEGLDGSSSDDHSATQSKSSPAEMKLQYHQVFSDTERDLPVNSDTSKSTLASDNAEHVDQGAVDKHSYYSTSPAVTELIEEHPLYSLS